MQVETGEQSRRLFLGGQGCHQFDLLAQAVSRFPSRVSSLPVIAGELAMNTIRCLLSWMSSEDFQVSCFQLRAAARRQIRRAARDRRSATASIKERSGT